MAEINSMIRLGIVSDVDTEKKRVRVYYPSLSNMVSDWLHVLQKPFYGNGEFAPFHVSAETGMADGHTHPVDISYSDNAWLPKEKDTVLVLYEYGPNAAGYVLGVVL